MNRLIVRLARFLHPREQDAVLGDLVECNATDQRAVLELIGLIARRQAALWKDWRPWLAVIGLIGIVCPVLSTVSFASSQPLIREFITHWTVGVFYTDGNLSVAQVFYIPVCCLVALLFCSCLCGASLAFLARRTFWLVGSLYFVVWTFPLPMLFAMVRAYIHGRFELRPCGLFELLAETAFHVLCFVIPSILGARFIRHRLRLSMACTGAVNNRRYNQD